MDNALNVSSTSQQSRGVNEKKSQTTSDSRDQAGGKRGVKSPAGYVLFTLSKDPGFNKRHEAKKRDLYS
jgi:hypothetical protein